MQVYISQLLIASVKEQRYNCQQKVKEKEKKKGREGKKENFFSHTDRRGKSILIELFYLILENYILKIMN